MFELIADSPMKDFSFSVAMCMKSPVGLLLFSGNQEYISLYEIPVRDQLFAYVYARNVSPAFIT